MFDLLFELTEWLRTTALLDFAFWLGETPLSLLMVENFWAVPIAQVIHLLAMAAAFAATLMLVLRVHNKAADHLPVPVIAARYVPWVWWGLVFILVSGTLMATAEPLRNLINALFWIKMILVLTAVAVSLAYFSAMRAQASAGGPGWQAGGGARATGVLLLLLCLIIVCGRWIAYVPV